MCENNNVCEGCESINDCDNPCKNCQNSFKCDHFNSDDDFMKNCEFVKNQEIEKNTFETIENETENKEISSMDKLLESI